MFPDDDRRPGDRAGQLRRGAAWLLLAAGLVGLGSGIAFGQGLLMAGGVMLAGFSGNLLAPDGRRPTHPR
ncbi:hypothetical protein [Streptomyces sp. NPDC048650]|uniref:hypothetical protein n=1 Tax=unclassified Streptomyces TaxID=2593676 RepID=UPI0037232243